MRWDKELKGELWGWPQNTDYEWGGEGTDSRGGASYGKGSDEGGPGGRGSRASCAGIVSELMCILLSPFPQYCISISLY